MKRGIVLLLATIGLGTGCSTKTETKFIPQSPIVIGPKDTSPAIYPAYLISPPDPAFRDQVHTYVRENISPHYIANLEGLTTGEGVQLRDRGTDDLAPRRLPMPDMTLEFVGIVQDGRTLSCRLITPDGLAESLVLGDHLCAIIQPD